MELITSLIKQLQSAKLATPSGQTISLTKGDGFRWDPSRLCIYYNPADPLACQLILHELGHATLGHSGYTRDIQLLQMERAAWNAANELALQYSVDITDDTVEDHLDTYRDWIHARSLCPKCAATGVQTGPRAYQCLSCGNHWSVNEARTCGLKRVNQTK